MALKDCSRCVVYTLQGKRLSKARVTYIGDGVSLFFADYRLRDTRSHSRVDFYDEQTGLIVIVYELVLHRDPSYPDMPEPRMAECRVQDVSEVIQRQKDIRAKVHIEIRYSSIEHGTFYITIENISAGGIYITTAQPSNKNGVATFAYRFRTLERRFEAVALRIKRIEEGRCSYGCWFINLMDGAEITIRSSVFKKLLEGRQERE